jgi:hypothetical protein
MVSHTSETLVSRDAQSEERFAAATGCHTPPALSAICPASLVAPIAPFAQCKSGAPQR